MSHESPIKPDRIENATLRVMRHRKHEFMNRYMDDPHWGSIASAQRTAQRQANETSARELVALYCAAEDDLIAENNAGCAYLSDAFNHTARNKILMVHNSLQTAADELAKRAPDTKKILAAYNFACDEMGYVVKMIHGSLRQAVALAAEDVGAEDVGADDEVAKRTTHCRSREAQIQAENIHDSLMRSYQVLKDNLDKSVSAER